MTASESTDKKMKKRSGAAAAKAAAPMKGAPAAGLKAKQQEVVEDLTLMPDKKERADLSEALFKCTGSFKRMVSSLLPYPLVLNYLHKELMEAQEMSAGSSEECLLTFVMKMEEPATKTFLEDAQTRIRAEPDVYGQNMVEDSWITDFQSQVDYVPGLSKGKRILDAESTEQFVTLGREMKTAGNNCFAARDFEMALTRYTQGVELLHNVECKENGPQQELMSLLAALLTNQAIAALRTSSWRTAIAACDACLAINPQNLKARARRAEAYKCLGELETATADLNWILKLKAEDLLQDHDSETAGLLLGTAKKDARRALQDITGLHIEESEAAKRMIAGADFTANRDKEKKTTVAVPEAQYMPSSTSTATHQRKKSSAVTEKLIDEVVALEIQEALVELYTREEVQQGLIALRKAAEYDSGRFIQRLRPFLVKLLQEPVLSKYEFGEGEAAYRKLERALGQHVSTSEQVKSNTKQILAMLMGDLWED